jgi:hypothetical protein
LKVAGDGSRAIGGIVMDANMVFATRAGPVSAVRRPA